MRLLKTKIKGLLIIKTNIYKDNRGFLFTDYLDSFLKQMMDNSGPKFLDILCRNFKLDIRKTIYHRMVK